MINIDLICVGELKSKIFKEAQKNILKKIKKAYNINIIEVDDEKNKNIDRLSEVEKIKDLEAQKILSKIKKGNYIITFEIEAKRYNNIGIRTLTDNICSENISMIIGGSVGLSKKISDMSNKKISISKMTFPHQLMRLIILEQFTL